MANSKSADPGSSWPALRDYSLGVWHGQVTLVVRGRGIERVVLEPIRPGSVDPQELWRLILPKGFPIVGGDQRTAKGRRPPAKPTATDKGCSMGWEPETRRQTQVFCGHLWSM